MKGGTFRNGKESNWYHTAAMCTMCSVWDITYRRVYQVIFLMASCNWHGCFVTARYNWHQHGTMCTMVFRYLILGMIMGQTVDFRKREALTTSLNAQCPNIKLDHMHSPSGPNSWQGVILKWPLNSDVASCSLMTTSKSLVFSSYSSSIHWGMTPVGLGSAYRNLYVFQGAFPAWIESMYKSSAEVQGMSL